MWDGASVVSSISVSRQDLARALFVGRSLSSRDRDDGNGTLRTLSYVYRVPERNRTATSLNRKPLLLLQPLLQMLLPTSAYSWSCLSNGKDARLNVTLLERKGWQTTDDSKSSCCHYWHWASLPMLLTFTNRQCIWLGRSPLPEFFTAVFFPRTGSCSGGCSSSSRGLRTVSGHCCVW